MTTFTIHNAETAPVASKPLLEKAQQRYGMIPNLMGLMAESPTAIEAYQTLAGFFEKSSFTPTSLAHCQARRHLHQRRRVKKPNATAANRATPEGSGTANTVD